MKYWRHLAMLANTVWIALFVVIAMNDGINDLGAFVAVIATLVLNNTLLLLGSGSDESWLGLVMHRKALEEKTKIQRLQE